MAPFTASTHIIAKCQLRAPESHPPKVSHAGTAVPSHGQQQNVSPFRANAGYALKMRSPLAIISVSATAFTQCVARTIQWWRFPAWCEMGGDSAMGRSRVGSVAGGAIGGFDVRDAST